MKRWDAKHRRVYQTGHWTVELQVSDDPTVVYDVYVRCHTCGGSAIWNGQRFGYQWFAISRSPQVTLLGFMVCPCTPERFEIKNGVCPPWLTHLEKVEWYLS